MRRNLIQYFAVGFILSTAAIHDIAVAATIQYSWDGKLVPVNAGNDPWALGPMGQAYQLSVTLTRDATDVFPGETQFAGFDTSNVKLLLETGEVEFLGHGVLDFIDNEGGSLDIVGFSGQFQRSGVPIEITANAALSANTFAFSQLVELPPFFASTETVTNSASGAPGPYSGLASVGAPVVVVPELNGLLIGFFLLGSIAVSRRTISQLNG